MLYNMRLGCVCMSLRGILDDTNNIKELNKEEIAELLKNDNVKAFLLFTFEKKEKLEINYTKLLNDLGIPPNLIGYDCLKNAISLCLENDYKKHFMKLYKDIGLISHKSEKSIDRNIRTVVEISINNMDKELMEELFGYSLSYDRDKPCNSHYIYTIVDYLKNNTKYLT